MTVKNSWSKITLITLLFGQSLVGSGQSSKVDSLHNQLFNTDDSKVQAQILLSLSNTYFRLSPPNHDSALHFAQKSLQLAMDNNVDTLIAKSYSQVAHMYFAKRDYANSIENHLKSAEEFKKGNDLVGYAREIKEAGYTAYIKSENKRALELLESSFQVSDSIGYLRGKANSYTHIGTIYLSQGEFPIALSYLLKSAEFHEELGVSTGLSNCYTKISNLYFEIGAYDEGSEYSQKSLMVNNSINNLRGMAIDNELLAILHSKKGNYDSSLHFIEQAYDLNGEVSNIEGQAANLNRMGSILLLKGEPHKAFEKANEGLRMRSDLKVNPRAMTYSYFTLADIYYHLDSTSQAERFAMQAFNQSVKLNLQSYIVSSSNLLYNTYSKLGDYNKAFEYLETYMAYKDSLFNEDLTKEITKLELRKDLQRLEQEAKYQQNQIVLLERDQEIKQLWVLIPIIGFSLVLFIAFFLYYRFLHKSRAHRKLKETQSQLVQAEKMSSLGQLTAGIAHEINNPMNFVAGGVYSLREYIKDLENLIMPEDLEQGENFEQMHGLLNSMQNGVDRTTKIVDHLRTYSRLDKGTLKEYDIEENLQATLTLLSHKIGNDVKVDVQIEKVEDFYAYGGRLNQVITNLISNSVDSILEKTSPTGVISIRAFQNDKYVIIEVEDNGIGIPESNIDKIFDPFYTSKPVGSGTGLGLSISKTIIQEHKGTLDVESIVGQGTKFILTMHRHLDWSKDSKHY